MNKKQYADLVDRELAAIKDVITRKNNDYTGGSDSAFANFEVTEKLGLSKASTGVLIRMVDKIQRLKTFLEKGELKVKGESAQDAARDIIGYSLVLLGMLEEGKAEEKPAKPSKELPQPGQTWRTADGTVVRVKAERYGDEYPISSNYKGYHAYTSDGVSCIKHGPANLVERVDGRSPDISEAP